MDKDKLEGCRQLASWLSDLYWTAPSRATMAAFEPLCAESAEFDIEEAEALGRVVEGVDDAGLKDIAVDHTDLFYGVKPDAPFPYESIYRGEQRLLMQAPAGEVKKVYEAEGYAPDQGDSREPEDHISYELGYLAFLLEAARDAHERGDAARAGELMDKKDAFVQEHGLRWIPRFCDDVRRRSSTEFLKLTSSITERTVAAIADL